MDLWLGSTSEAILALKAVSGGLQILPWGRHVSDDPRLADPNRHPPQACASQQLPSSPARTAEYGLSASVGPMSVGTLISGGDEYGMLKDSGSPVARCVDPTQQMIGCLLLGRLLLSLGGATSTGC